MPTIQAAQWSQMQQHLDQRQSALVTKKLCELWPERTRSVPADVLQRFSQACVEDAHRAQLWQDRSVVRLANLRMAFGGRFPEPERHPELAAVLQQPGLDEGERLSRLWTATLAMHPAVAARQARSRPWA